MNLKKFAVSGLIVLAIVVAVCMYFSGTIVNITTPKIKLLSIKQGKLETTTTLTGTLVYTATKDITVEVPDESSITIRDSYVRAGSRVEEGDKLFDAELNGYASKLQTAQTEYADAVDALEEYERKNSSLTLSSRDEAYATAYTAWKAANRAVSSAKMTVRLKLSAQKLTWEDETTYPEGADDSLIAAIDTYWAALETKKTTDADFNRASRYGIDDTVWEYIQERESLSAKVTECEEKCLELQSEADRITVITAPSAGYITAINVKAGDSYDGTSAMYTMTTAEGVPSLQFDLTDVSRNISKGDTVTLSTTQYGTLTAKVTSIGYNSEGKRCAYVTVTEEIAEAYGSLYSLGQQSEITATMVSKSSTTSSLVPVSAIHGSGNDRYVFVIDTTSSTLSGKTMTVRKTSVTVAAEANGYAAVNEDLSYYKLAYMEDRSLEDGSTVMEYTK